MKLATLTLALLVGSVPTTSQAQTIGFGGLPGANGSPLFGSYAEAGFSVSLFAGALCEGHAFGNPAPSVFGGLVCNFSTRTGVLRVVRTDGSAFGFVATDLSSQNGPGAFSFQGFLGGSSQFFSSGAIAEGFSTYAGPGPTSAIDELRISLSTTGSSFTIDNIQLQSVTVIPEPATIVLLATGLAGVLGLARHRRRDG
jgi:PEP-CTERM motif